jgi:hypothetical protein
LSGPVEPKAGRAGNLFAIEQAHRDVTLVDYFDLLPNPASSGRFMCDVENAIGPRLCRLPTSPAAIW